MKTLILLLSLFCVNAYGQKGTLTLDSIPRATTLSFAVPYSPKITGINGIFIAMSFNPKWPICFTGDSLAVIRKMFMDSYYFDFDSYDCWSEDLSRYKAHSLLEVDVRVYYPSKTFKDYTFAEFKKIMFE